MDAFFTNLGLFVVGLVVVAVFGLIEAVFVSLCWNYIMPFLFGLPTIGYWQAFVLSFLCGMLFKNSSSTNTKKDN